MDPVPISMSILIRMQVRHLRSKIQPKMSSVLTNLKGDASGPNDDAPDSISIQGSGGIVWVHHVTAIGDGTDDMDGFIDVHAENVTISWCRAKDWSAVHLVILIRIPPNMHVTFHHNLFGHNRDGMPSTFSDNAYAHAYRTTG